ncbi:phage gp6-like head-tail connector protein [Luteibacter flocculans]|uniref:Phage gp6-like head-tail connector protein n=1 Tax=Luteibacter flocculans TaxID=2780091 RepID=A0ABY4T3Y4_9GAMM|nr:head-tail connector protein [Luteibacter flocculans]URL59618.1 phage gp6-like head-tail connector protein [Luteibacter flocculans]
MDLITIEEARAHCRADSDDDAMLEVYGAAAEESVQNFLNRRVFKDSDALAAAVLDDSAGDDPMVVTPVVKAAALLILGHLYRNREEVVMGDSAAAAQLPVGATTLLWPHRVGLGV